MAKFLFMNDHEPKMNCFGTLEEIRENLSVWDWEEEDLDSNGIPNIPDVTSLVEVRDLDEALEIAGTLLSGSVIPL